MFTDIETVWILENPEPSLTVPLCQCYVEVMQNLHSYSNMNLFTVCSVVKGHRTAGLFQGRT